MWSLTHVKELCSTYDIRPHKTSGQTFLFDETVAEEIASATEHRDLPCIEVGPGLGILTEQLVQRHPRVIAVELDRHVLPALTATLGTTKNLEIVRDDVFHWWKETGRLAFADTPFIIVSNLPYAITSSFIREFLTTDSKPVEMVLMVQREVAARMTAQPGKMSLLALSVQSLCAATEVCTVTRDRFWPRPAVDSTVVRFADMTQRTENRALFQVARAGFAARRKQLKNGLAALLHLDTDVVAPILETEGIRPQARPQDLGVEDWEHITAALQARRLLPA